MALFVDGPAPTIDDLIDQDSGLAGVAQTTDINVSTKLRLAQEEIRTQIELWIIRPRPAMDLLWEPAIRIEQVVVTDELKRWETMHALAMVYRDAYFSLLVDRYQGKWQEYAKQARNASDSFIARGLGLVSNPLHQPQAPMLSSITGPQAGGTFYASVAWANAAGQESAASVASSITLGDGHLMTVGVVNAPANAVGFWVYAGTALNTMYRQNEIAQSVSLTYTYLPGQVTQGALPGYGQKPDFVRPLTRTQLRG
jgi:hypothetical protein